MEGHAGHSVNKGKACSLSMCLERGRGEKGKKVTLARYKLLESRDLNRPKICTNSSQMVALMLDRE